MGTPLAEPLDSGQQQLQRAELRPFLAAALRQAEGASQFVAILILTLARLDRIDAILGVSSIDVSRRAQKRLTGVLREDDRYVAISDEKICIILPKLRSSTQAWLAAGKIQAAMEPAFSIDENRVRIRPVIGIACFPDHGNDAESLVAGADLSNTQAQARDIGIQIFQRQQHRESDSYRGLDLALRQAINANELMVYYQPQVDIASGKCRSVEALVRWHHPQHGAIPPPVIIRLAETCGLIGSVTNLVLNAALRHLADLQRQDMVINTSVNLSANTLADADLADTIEQSLLTWGVDPAQLTLEITEGSTITDMEGTLTVMQRLKQIGVELSADDFGTGYSSLSYLKRFPLDELKIDKLFVQHMREVKSDQRIVRSVIDLAHNFELRCVAEGVEDRATLEELRKMGCDLVQGYIFSPAIPIEQLLPWLKKQNSSK